MRSRDGWGCCPEPRCHPERSEGSAFRWPLRSPGTAWRVPGMKILLVNWQDRENPQAGGAEIHLHEIFGRLATNGHEVTLLCGGWPKSPPHALLDGISVHRVGTRHSFPFLARDYYNKRLRGLGHDVL